jgi:hypothetical protein
MYLACIGRLNLQILENGSKFDGFHIIQGLQGLHWFWKISHQINRQLSIFVTNSVRKETKFHSILKWTHTCTSIISPKF